MSVTAVLAAFIPQCNEFSLRGVDDGLSAMLISILLVISFLTLDSLIVAYKFIQPRRAYYHRHRLQSGADVSTVNVELQSRSYPIYIGNNLLDGGLLGSLINSNKALVVTNTIVAPLYLDKVMHALRSKGLDTFQITLPDGEIYKNMDTLMTILDSAMEAKLDRKSVMVALGGGVVGDMCGFAASIYQRGIRFIQVPTTLMAMVDSSVGGKTAVNHPLGKNMIGTFYQPSAVVTDLHTLRTLPDREYFSGIAEVIKYGLIQDPALFMWLEGNIDRVVCRDREAVRYVVKRCCEIKAAVVAMDETEDSAAGTRAALNLGHTFGHAIEAGLGYGTLLHGEAVSIGMLMAAELSCRMGWIDQQLLSRLESLLLRAQLPVAFSQGASTRNRPTAPPLPALTTDVFLVLMGRDKKVSAGQLHLVLMHGPLGSLTVTNTFDQQLLTDVVAKYCGS